MTTQTTNTPSKNRKTANSGMTLRLSRGRTLKITFRPRIRLSPLLVKLLALASGIFAFGAGIAHAAPPVNALPTGGQVVSGVSTIQQAGSTLNINQASQKTIINWQSFDIGSQAAVNFYQPNANAIALNRIVGNNASQIYGKLNANGQVFLLNPYGTLFAPGAQVNVGGLLNSTMQMNDADFLAGNYQLSNPGLGIIDNQSIINANSIAFAANDINNSGNLIATNVSLVAGNTIAVDISGDGLIRARVENPSLQAHITNSGMIDAVHQVTMSAGQAKDTLNNVVNNSGIIRATGLSNEGGVITLQGGTTLNSGSLDASNAIGKGGVVAMLGEHVGVTGFGSINASGETGGGTILVGGDFQGKNANVQNASRTFFGADASLKADAITSGDGGKVVVWADEVTRGYGNISARGGAASGNGGFVEVSGKQSLIYEAQTDTRAPNGKTGSLLLDPDSITISSTGVNTASTNLSFSAGPSLSVINPTTLNTASSNIILQANDDISFDEAVTIAAAGVGITAQAGGFLIIQAPLTTTGGVVNLVAGDPGSLTSPSEGALAINAAIDTTRGGVAPNGANVLLESNISDVGGNSVQLNANVNAGTLGDIIITDNGGATDQFSGILIGNKLTVQATHNVNLTGANQLNKVQIETSNSLPTTISNISFTNTRALTIDNMLVDSGGGDGGSITVSNTGNVSLNGSVTVANGNISLSTTGSLTSTSNANVIDRSSSTNPGSITIISGSNIGTAANNVYLAPGTGNVSLTAGSGAGSNIYTKQVLNALDTGKYTVNAALANATVSLSSSNNINITNLTNFTTTNDNLIFSTNGGDINIANGVAATANSFSFDTLGVGNDIFIGSGAGTVSLNANNPTGVEFTAHTVVFNSNLTDAIPTINDNIQITAGAGGVSGSGGITTSLLRIDSEGAVNLTGSNVVNKIAANVLNSGAAFNFTNAGALEVSSLFGIDGITTNNGNVGINASDIVINNAINTTGGNLNIFSSYNPLNINADLDANDVTLGTFDGSISLNSANITASGNVAINSGYDILNHTGTDAGLVYINGQIKQTGASASTMNINADANILLEQGSKLTADSNSSDITLKSDANNNGLTNWGGITLNGSSGGGNEVRIDSKGGNITLTGGSGYAESSIGDGVQLNYAQLDARDSSGTVGGNITIHGKTSYTDSPAAGVNANESTIITRDTGAIDITGKVDAAAGNFGMRGVLLTSSTAVTTVDGDITILGDASSLNNTSFGDTSDGVLINAGALIVSNGSGNINITGKSAVGGLSQAGIAIADNPTEIDVHGSGTITLDGTSNGTGNSSYGIVMFDGARVEAEGTGNINMTGQANSDAHGIDIGDGGAIVQTFQGNDVSLKAGNLSTTVSQIELAGSTIGGTSGSLLFLNPINSSAGIVVGGDGINTLVFGLFNLSDADLSTFTGFDAVQIGDTAHNGPFNVATLNTVSGSNQQLNLVSNSSNINFIAPTTIATSMLVNANNGSVSLNSLDVTGHLTALAKNDITLQTGTAINASDKILLAAQTGNFINSSTSTALFATNHWTVVSQSPTLDTRGGLVYNYKQYNTTYDPLSSSFSQALLGTGDGFVYAVSPTLTPTLTGTITKVYNSNNTANVLAANISTTGAIDGDTVTFSGTATYDTKNVGTSKTVTLASINPVVTNGAATVYGYTAPTSITGNIGEITQANITAVTGITASNKTTYDATTTATLNTGSASFTGIIGTDVLSVATATGAFADKNVGVGKTVNITGITLAGTDAANYNLTNNTATTTANITNKASITAVTGITASNKTTYDATTSATLNTGSAGFTGILGSDALLVGTATGAFADKNVGTNKTVNITGITLAGTDAANYNLTNNTATATADIVNKANLTVTATGVNKLFDGTTTAQVALADNRIGSDNLTITKSTADFIDSDIGANKLINVSGISISGGIDAGNYNLLNTSATTFADIFDDNGVAATNLTEKTVVDSTSDLALVVIPVQLKVLNEDGTESLMTVDVPKGKVLSCK